MLHDLARHLQQRLHVVTTASCATGRLRDHIARFIDRAGLLVLPWQRRNAVFDAMFGALPERLHRTFRIPMLVVRQPALASYRRVLVPVKLESHAVSMIKAARSLSRDPRMRLLHVLGTSPEESPRIAEVSERALRMQRQYRSSTAYVVLNELMARAGADEDGAAAVVSFGHVPARVLEVARASKAQLIVVGKERRSLLSEIFFTDLPKCLLFNAEADVLFLPVKKDTSDIPEEIQSWPKV
jgi:nucleotide-binding universal stress UspA family protein